MYLSLLKMWAWSFFRRRIEQADLWPGGGDADQRVLCGEQLPGHSRQCPGHYPGHRVPDSLHNLQAVM